MLLAALTLEHNRADASPPSAVDRREAGELAAAAGTSHDGLRSRSGRRERDPLLLLGWNGRPHESARRVGCVPGPVLTAPPRSERRVRRPLQHAPRQVIRDNYLLNHFDEVNQIVGLRS